jgi:hypothetical protein
MLFELEALSDEEAQRLLALEKARMGDEEPRTPVAGNG